MKQILAALPLAMLMACTPENPEDIGPEIEVVEAARALDTTRVVMRYAEDGGAIPKEDEARAMRFAARLACREGEEAIPDRRERANGLLTGYVFCVASPVETELVEEVRVTG